MTGALPSGWYPLAFEPIATLEALLRAQEPLSRADVTEEIRADGAWGTGVPYVRSALDMAGGKLCRADLFEIADEDRTSNPLRLFWAVMAWGIMGDWRHVRTIDISLQSARPGMLAEAFSAAYSCRGSELEIRNVYKSLLADEAIQGLGPSFATKMYFFAADQKRTGAKPLICDSRTELGMTMLGYRVNRESVRSYSSYCLLVDEWAIELAARGVDSRRPGDTLHGDIEAALYTLGALAGSEREWAAALIEETFHSPLECVNAGRVVDRLGPEIAERWAESATIRTVPRPAP